MYPNTIKLKQVGNLSPSQCKKKTALLFASDASFLLNALKRCDEFEKAEKNEVKTNM